MHTEQSLRAALARDSDAPVGGNDVAIAVRDVSKVYRIYDRPQHRLWESLLLGRRQFYREFHALQPLSFDVRRGETVGIIGRNGSGKSTLLQTVCGTLTPTTGVVRTQGRVAALLELGSGFSPEFTGRENVRLNAAMFGLSSSEIDARFDRITEFAEIGAFIDQPVKTYSSGMVVRLAFAVIANIDADLLVIDEALAVGDVFFVQKCMRWLRGFMRRGTLLFVSHDTGSVVNLCDRAIWLHRGALVMDDSARLVAETYLQSLAEESYGGRSGDAVVEIIREQTRQRRAPAPASAATPKQAAASAMSPASAPSSSFATSAPSAASATGATFAAGAAVADAEWTPSGRLDLQWTDLDSRSFGKGGARIDDVALLDGHDRTMQSIRGGEMVTLLIRSTAHGHLRSPIVGFIVKDRLGQLLFGDNTFERYKHHPVPVAAGGHLETRFTFAVPILAPGDYAIDVAIADGTQLDHVQHHWIHEAVVFRSVTDHVASGLLGLPMHEVSMSQVG
jgi:lipopolysaccharide transport system ATP-binding protein